MTPTTIDPVLLASGRHLVVMQGAPGSGKSTRAEQLAAAHASAVILSTDDFWMRSGEYRFVPAIRHVAHGWNEKRAEKRMQEAATNGQADDLVIIDNTNGGPASARAYVASAHAHGYAVHVLLVDPGLDECLRRNALRPANRRVPDEQVVKMHGKMGDLTPLLLPRSSD
jgi:predicted kinase